MKCPMIDTVYQVQYPEFSSSFLYKFRVITFVQLNQASLKFKLYQISREFTNDDERNPTSTGSI
jgi:hypothetical protein